MTKVDVFEVHSADVDAAPSDGHALVTLHTNRGTIVLSMPPDVLMLISEQAALSQSHKDTPSE